MPLKLTSLPLPENLNDNIAEASQIFGIVARLDARFPNPCSVPTWMYSIRTLDVERLNPEAYVTLNDWFFERGWIITQQEFPKETNLIWDFFSEKHGVTLNGSHVFHATRKRYLASIENIGLLPGSTERCNSDRLDTSRNIYFAENLGFRGDSNGKRDGTAYWWMEHFATELAHEPEGWAIVSVDTSDLAECKVIRDPWSSTGVVCRTDQPIPATRIVA